MNRKQNNEIWFTDKEYAKILDELVIVCVDTLIYNTKKGIFLGYRNRLPIYDWWIFGGRMKAQETFHESALRGLEREIGLVPENTPVEIGFFDIVWEKRQETPQENGCHVLLVAMKCKLSDREAELASIKGNDHAEGRWFTSSDLKNYNFHPKITAIIQSSGVLEIIP